MPESSKRPADTLYPDLEHELGTTRRMLERFPSGHNDWRPHEKSMTLGNLAAHVAELPQYATMIIGTDELDFAKRGYTPTKCDSAQDLLAVFDAKVAELRPALEGFGPDDVSTPWTMRNGDHVIVTAPKAVLVRNVMINHLVHHRAQLGVYYRMLGVPLPSSYGPSADEPI